MPLLHHTTMAGEDTPDADLCPLCGGGDGPARVSLAKRRLFPVNTLVMAVSTLRESLASQRCAVIGLQADLEVERSHGRWRPHALPWTTEEPGQGGAVRSEVAR